MDNESRIAQPVSISVTGSGFRDARSHPAGTARRFSYSASG